LKKKQPTSKNARQDRVNLKTGLSLPCSIHQLAPANSLNTLHTSTVTFAVSRVSTPSALKRSGACRYPIDKVFTQLIDPFLPGNMPFQAVFLRFYPNQNTNT
jgi:hypothetical protein